MRQEITHTSRYLGILFWVFATVSLYLMSLYSYLLFHSLAEIFSIIVACGIFMLAWNSRRIIDNNYLLFVGIAYLFIGGMDLVHTLAYKGMGVFEGDTANLGIQLWIATRYLESLSLLAAIFFLRRKFSPWMVFIGYMIAVSLLMLSVFYWKIFPGCFVEGMGLTPFKKVSEYVISTLLLISAVFLIHYRDEFDETVFRLLIASIILTVFAELAFTLYVSVYGLPNFVGHILKILSFYFIYEAVIATGLTKPYNVLFRNLKQSEEAIRKSERELRDLNQQLERAKDLLRQSFQRYVGAQIVDKIVQGAEPVNLSGERKPVSILLSDIRGFTALSEQLEAEELVRFLNTHFSAMIEIIFEYEGTLDKFMGDAILALFGAPLSHEDDPLRSVRAAIAMQAKLRELNEIWAVGGKNRVKMGIGISTGEVIVGNIGSEKRLEYTAIGEDVNYAQRIEALTKELPADILISEQTYEETKEHIIAEKFGPLTIRGKKEPISVYGVKELKS
jgi:class 3 adenylate cyclase